MKFPRNGSFAANASLLALGTMLGGGVTWFVGYVRHAEPVLTARVRTSKELGLPSKGFTPEKAIAAKVEPSFPESRGETFRKAGQEAAAKDPEAAFAEAKNIAGNQDRIDFLRGLYGQWSMNDAAAAAAHAKANLNPGAALSEVLSITARNWGAKDPKAAWQWTEDMLSGPLKLETETSLLQGWTGNDPVAASNWLLGSGLTTAPFFDAVASTRAATDPKGAVDFAQSIPDDLTRKTTTIAAVNKIAESDPPAAAPYVGPILNDAKNPDGIDLASALTNLWGTTDPAGSAKWIDTLAPGPAKSEATSTLATVWAASDINAAIGWSQQVSDPDMRQQIISHLGTTWGAIEPDKAIQWLQTLPANEAKNGIEGAVNSWAATDPVGLRDWINTAGNSAISDTARLSLGDVMTDTDITSSMDLALGISDAKARDSATVRFLHEWRKTDPEGAQTWVSDQWNSLPGTTQARINQELQRNVIQK